MRSDIIKQLKEDGDYRTFFKNALKKFGAKTPAEMDDDEKTKFFNYIDSNWKAKVEEDKVRERIRTEIMNALGSIKLKEAVEEYNIALKRLNYKIKGVSTKK